MAHPTDVELRGHAPRELVDVLDAVSAARRMTRTELVNEVLAAWAADKRREAEAIFRVTTQGSSGAGR